MELDNGRIPLLNCSLDDVLSYLYLYLVQVRRLTGVLDSATAFLCTVEDTTSIVCCFVRHLQYEYYLVLV